ncbi:MAG: sigma-70 family RNA polymerase sigma factor [Nannocystaceae bacterium]|nr:sigma-70 family RNA polymerase sigma factor [Nannocystaceae bacterium]
MTVWTHGDVAGLAVATHRTLSFDAVFRDEHDFVWRTLRHYGVPEAGLDDATQDVFVVVHRRIADFDGRAPLRSWLIGIARRVGSRHRSRREAQARREAPLGAVEPSSSDPGPHSRAIRVEAADFVATFLDLLPPKLRGAFQLCEIEGMSAPEVADVLGIPVNTVYSRLRLARARFERALERRQLREKRSNSR